MTSETGSRVQTSSESSEIGSDSEQAFGDNATEQQKTIDNETCVDEQTTDQSNSDNGKSDESCVESVELLLKQQQDNELTIDCDVMQCMDDTASVSDAVTPSITSNTDVSVDDDSTDDDSNDNDSSDDDDDDEETDNGEAIKSDDDASEIGEASKSYSTNEAEVEVDVEQVVDVEAGVKQVIDDEEKERLAAILDEIRFKHLKIIHRGRNILDFESNVAKSWIIPSAHLPEHNIKVFMANRSQYHRLTPGWIDLPEHPMIKCGKCDFHYPVNEPTDKQEAAGSESSSLGNLMSSLNANAAAAAAVIVNTDRNSNSSPSMNGNCMGSMQNRTDINSIKGEY